jgi:hypothetical protein
MIFWEFKSGPVRGVLAGLVKDWSPRRLLSAAHCQPAMFADYHPATVRIAALSLRKRKAVRNQTCPIARTPQVK